ncbi:type IV secretory system conjugative DNA transfer family protein [Streptomyces sp. NPDC050548]|uniref:type IV secretory system conjugative DNA transfer family protein n=1 Tax=Streptomyces sp. NPDC050548 TaxID=3365629 RepID=UPI0037911E95
MTLAVVILVGGLALIAAVLGIRWLDARHWAKHLTAYQLRLPADLSADDVTRWLEIIAGITQPPKWSLLSYPPIALEVVADRKGIRHYVVVPESLHSKLMGLMRAGLPGARLDAAPEYLSSRTPATVAAEAKVTSVSRSLLDGRAEMASSALLASLQPLKRDELVRYQVVMTAVGTPAPVHSAAPRGTEGSWSTYLVEGELPEDAEAIRAARRKQDVPLLNVTVRLGVTANSRKRAHKLFGRTWGTLHSLNAPGVRLVRRWLPSGVVRTRLQSWALPLTRWPLVLNSRELPGLLGFRLGGISLPGLALGASRQLAPSPSVPTRGTVLAQTNYAGMSRSLALTLKDRLRHVYLLGPTGVGKSTLIANMALQDIAAGHGLALIDPKSDLVGDILARFPEERADDLIVLDPASNDKPVGFNLLGSLHSEAQKELVVDHVVHIMSALWHDSWGPRTSDVLRNSLLTLTHTSAPDGSAFTLAEVPELLTNPTFRRMVTGQRTVPESVRSFWYAYEQMSDNERLNVIGPSLNKLRSFLTRTPLRLMLGQSVGINVADVFRKRRILLVQLTKGTLGTETAQLLGALLVASLWQATLTRAGIPADHRRPAFLYLDEFQDVLKLPLDVADMLAQARGLGVGVVLANQHLGQLPEAVKTAVLGTARSQVVFQLDYDDARTLANRFTPLTAEDLMNAAPYEIAARLSVGGQTLAPVTGATLPLPDMRTGADISTLSRERYGTPRAVVEAAFKTRTGSRDEGRQLGRRTRRGEA